ncbi:hypothetical protein [Amycolatopsis sp. lyj-90]|uniref:hypothetical protein n=1 Tax=Amycolatopsis sp. lyj-90 TaxID=2789285 RepID=UPI00397E6A7D
MLVDPTDEAADVLFGRAFRTGERVMIGLGAVLARANASHAHRVAASSGGRHVIAERSGHYIPKTEPEAIAREIVRML